MAEIKNKKGFVAIRSRHSSTTTWLKNQIPTVHSVVYRHGSKSSIERDIEINTIEAIELSSDKIAMKHAFNGDNTPSYWYWNGIYWKDNNKDDSNELNDEQLKQVIDYPVLSKLQFRSKGLGMVKHDVEEDLTAIMDEIKQRHATGRNQKYLEKFHNYAREYRLHTALGNCFYSCRKARKEGNHQFFRNDSNCVWFTQYDNEGNIKDNFQQPQNWQAIVAECVRLQKLIGLDITAFDVIVSDQEDFKILECNSAPSIAEGTGYFYRTIIPLIIQDKIK